MQQELGTRYAAGTRNLLFSRDEELVMQQGRGTCYAAGTRNLLCSRDEELVMQQGRRTCYAAGKRHYSTYAAMEIHLSCSKKEICICYAVYMKYINCKQANK
jgi:hypothetical protein